jgi:hypothetical protein
MRANWGNWGNWGNWAGGSISGKSPFRSFRHKVECRVAVQVLVPQEFMPSVW